MQWQLVCAVVGWCLAMAHGLAWADTGKVQRLDVASVQWHTPSQAAAALPERTPLPYGWDQRHPGQAGQATFTLTFDAPTAVRQPWALYFHRLGNAYEVRLNGSLLEQNGGLDAYNGADFAKVPRLVPVPSDALMPRNQLEIRIRADTGRRGGVPVVVVGPREALEPEYHRAALVRVGSSAVLTVFSLLVALIAGVLWLTQTDPRPEQRGVRDPLYLFAAVAEGAWALFIGDTLIEHQPLPWNTWSVLINLALGLWLAAMYMVCHTVAGWRAHRYSRRSQWLLLGILLAGPPTALAATWAGQPQWLTLWQACFVVLFIPSLLLLLRQAWRQSEWTTRMMALAFLINFPVGVHDFYALRLGDAFSAHALLRYSVTLFGLALGAIAINRFRRANIQVRDMLDTLALRIQDREHELRQTYARMERIAREQERSQERTRILRDMHDGVGSHISAAIRQLESGHARSGEILHTLRDSLDQLKLSIDALNLPAGDVNALLANMRYRLEPRFRAMDIGLEWAVALLPLRESLDSAAMRQLQFLLFEAFSNVIQHAQARVLRVEADASPDSGHAQTVRIGIRDDGCGFDPERVERHGLHSMHERTRAIGARLTLHSRPGQTLIEILLP